MVIKSSILYLVFPLIDLVFKPVLTNRSSSSIVILLYIYIV